MLGGFVIELFGHPHEANADREPAKDETLAVHMGFFLFESLSAGTQGLFGQRLMAPSGARFHGFNGVRAHRLGAHLAANADNTQGPAKDAKQSGGQMPDRLPSVISQSCQDQADAQSKEEKRTCGILCHHLTLFDGITPRRCR